MTNMPHRTSILTWKYIKKRYIVWFCGFMQPHSPPPKSTAPYQVRKGFGTCYDSCREEEKGRQEWYEAWLVEVCGGHGETLVGEEDAQQDPPHQGLPALEDGWVGELKHRENILQKEQNCVLWRLTALTHASPHLYYTCLSHSLQLIK